MPEQLNAICAMHGAFLARRCRGPVTRITLDLPHVIIIGAACERHLKAEFRFLYNSGRSAPL